MSELSEKADGDYFKVANLLILGSNTGKSYAALGYTLHNRAVLPLCKNENPSWDKKKT